MSATAAQMPPATFAGKLFSFAEAIKFSHSIFALPFALVAMLVAAKGVPSAWTIFLIVMACVGARTAAMAFNRLADLRFDAANPRTARRALVTGELSREFMTGALLAGAGVFFLAAGLLSLTCLYLAPPTLGVLLGYSLAKRYTDWSHVVLGVALGLAPLGAWVAITGTIGLTPIFLALAVVLWVAGFDTLYACQDYEFDRDNAELHSLPKRYGMAGAMAKARQMHAISFVCFALFWFAAGSVLGLPTLAAILAVGGLLIYQHGLVSPRDLSRLNAAFFTVNGIIAVLFFVVVLLDVVFI